MMMMAKRLVCFFNRKRKKKKGKERRRKRKRKGKTIDLDRSALYNVGYISTIIHYLTTYLP